MKEPLYPGGSSDVDGQHDRTKPWTRLPKWSYSGPNEGPAERRVSEALAAVTQPGADLTDIVRPPLDMIQLFPPRYGYRQTTIGIQDMIDIGRTYNAPANFSGTDAGYTGASRNANASSW